MLHILVGYAKGGGVDARWSVVFGGEEFFQITKRLHNRLHGVAGDTGALGPREAASYGAMTGANAAALKGRLRRGDVVILHDPQTIGLAGPLAEQGARVVWRCHIGTDRTNAFTNEAWAFLAPHLRQCQAFVFSHWGFVPSDLTGSDVWLIPPSIDPFTAKNRPLPRPRVNALLARIGLVDGGGAREVAVPAVMGGAGPLEVGDRLVVQVSRWDRLKDMQGVMEGFADRVVGQSDARLALVGPAVAAVSDDPEGADVLAECMAAWEALPVRHRNAVRLVALPMDDIEVNALMVNAVQRHATVVVQKSLEEGFGLTVAEAMWKSRPVVASAIGGIVEQMVPGTGILLPDPSDLAGFGDTLAGLLARPEEMATMGRRARRHIREGFLGDRHLIAYARLIEHLAQG